MQLSITDDVSY